ncbi:MAG: shikimate kinase [Clostridia bacterium]|nr:shikimate kinase [Clostridia bacterium]
MKSQFNNLILIGMPGAGKSTVGIILAKTLCRDFVDTDLLLQNKIKTTLQNYINKNGEDAFLKLEEEVICNLDVKNSVIATGGSVVLSEKAMNHLKTLGTIIYLDVSLEILYNRLNNIKVRGVVGTKNHSLLELFEKRTPLYEKYADISLITDGLNTEQTIEFLIAKFNEYIKECENKK